jgi:hypothetical protein
MGHPCFLLLLFLGARFPPEHKPPPVKKSRNNEKEDGGADEPVISPALLYQAADGLRRFKNVEDNNKNPYPTETSKTSAFRRGDTARGSSFTSGC